MTNPSKERADLLWLFNYHVEVSIPVDFAIQETFPDMSISEFCSRHALRVTTQLIKTPWGLLQHFIFTKKVEDNEL